MKKSTSIIIVIVIAVLIIVGVHHWVDEVAEEAVKTICREEDINADYFYRATPLINKGGIFVYIDIYFYVTEPQRSIHIFVIYKNGEYCYTIPNYGGW